MANCVKHDLKQQRNINSVFPQRHTPNQGGVAGMWNPPSDKQPFSHSNIPPSTTNKLNPADYNTGRKSVAYYQQNPAPIVQMSSNCTQSKQNPHMHTDSLLNSSHPWQHFAGWSFSSRW